MSYPHTATTIVGRFGTVYGIRGWIKISSFTEKAESIFDYSEWLVSQNGRWQIIRFDEWRAHRKGFITKLADFNLRGESQALIGMDVLVDTCALPPLSDNEYYWRELIGMQVINRQSYNFGQVVSLLETGSNDVLVVRANLKDISGKRDQLIPFIESQMIDEIDRQSRLITVNWDPSF